VKLITAVVKPGKLDDVMRAVSGAGARGLTVTEARGFGQQYGHIGPGAPAGQNALVLPKLCIDVLVQHESAGPGDEANPGRGGDESPGRGLPWCVSRSCGGRPAWPRTPSR